MGRRYAAGNKPTSVLFNAERLRGSSAESRPRIRLCGVDWALRAESDGNQGQEEAQSRDPEPSEDYQVRRRENRFDLPDVADNLVDVEVPSQPHFGRPEAQA